jgi:predicted transcriptional regulator
MPKLQKGAAQEGGKMRRRKESRSGWELIGVILGEITAEGKRAKKTRIMKGAYLDWWSFEKYFARLLEGGFIKEVDDPTVGKIYELTDRGADLKGRLNEVESILH